MQGADDMYKTEKEHQISLTDFGQPLGMKLDPNNRWIKKRCLFRGMNRKKNMQRNSPILKARLQNRSELREDNIGYMRQVSIFCAENVSHKSKKRLSEFCKKNVRVKKSEQQ